MNTAFVRTNNKLDIVIEKLSLSKSCFLLIILFINVGISLSKAQSPDVANFYTKVSPPAPEASRFVQYGNYTTGITGRPEISIPIFNIKSSGLELPVSLSYEGTGCVPDEIASWVGSGWLLNTGGVITRVVMGLPDDGNNGFLSTTLYDYNQLSNPDNFNTYRDYLLDVTQNRADTEPDMYYYNFNGHSGQFTYDQSKNIYQIPQTALNITRVGNHFQIIDETGKTYIFAGNENSDSEMGVSGDAQPYCTTSWWLTSIQNAEKTDSIKLEYQQDLSESEVKLNFSAAYGPTAILEYGGGSDPTQYYAITGNELDLYQSELHREWYPLRISRITFKNGKIEFNRISDRQDGGSSRLDNIVIYSQINGTYNPLKTFKLVTDYFQYTGPVPFGVPYYSNSIGRYRLKLNALQEYNAQNTLVDTHSFNYYTDVMVPFRGSFGQDYWGYYNGADYNTTLLPALTTYDQAKNFGGAIRESNEASMKAGVLKSITYPTGGYTNFNWEANRYLFSNTTTSTAEQFCSAYGNNSYNDPHPSQRLTFTQAADDLQATLLIDLSTVSKSGLPNYDNPSYQDISEEAFPNVYIKNLTTGEVIYTAANTNYSASSLFYTINLNLFAGNTYELGSDCYINSLDAHANITVTYHTTNTLNDVRLAGGLRLSGLQNYEKDGSLLAGEKYKYGSGESGYGSLSSMVDQLYNFSYSRLYKYSADALCGLSSGAQRFVYSSSSVYGLGLSSGSSVIYPVISKYHIDGNNDIGKTIYYYQNDSEYSPFILPAGAETPVYPRSFKWMTGNLLQVEDYKNTGNGYQLKKQTTNTYQTLRYLENYVTKIGFNVDMSQSKCYFQNNYYVSHIDIESGNFKLVSTNTKEFEDSGVTETTKAYTYDNQYYDFPVTEQFTNSKGNVLKTLSKYPFNKSNITALGTNASAAIDRMLLNNNVSPVVEKEIYKDDVLLSRQKTDYKIWSDISPDLIKPENIFLQNSSGPLENRVSCYRYDNTGNLAEQSIVNGIHSGYLWGYNQLYLIAECKNASNTEFYYEGFEESTTSGLQTNGGHTGHNYVSGNFQVNWTPPNGRVYVISYWFLNPSTGLWAYQSPQPYSGNMTLSNGTSYDDIRVYPSDAQMMTYTYDPLIGMTSSTDAKGETMYYEYDSFQRLMNIKDKDRNVLGHTDYHYQGQ